MALENYLRFYFITQFHRRVEDFQVLFYLLRASNVLFETVESVERIK